MKIVVFALSVLLIAGCVTTAMSPNRTPTAEEQARSKQLEACGIISQSMGKEQSPFYNYCVNNEPKNSVAWLEEWANKRATPADLCRMDGNIPNSDPIPKLIKARKIQCDGMMKAEVSDMIGKLDTDNLCTVWNARTQNDGVLPAQEVNRMVDKEVAARKVDCAAVISAGRDRSQRQEALQQQMAYQDMQYRSMQRAQNAAAWQNFFSEMQRNNSTSYSNPYLDNYMRRPVQTDCYRYGSQISCTSR